MLFLSNNDRIMLSIITCDLLKSCYFMSIFNRMRLTVISRSNTGPREITLVKPPRVWSVPTQVTAWEYQLGYVVCGWRNGLRLGIGNSGVEFKLHSPRRLGNQEKRHAQQGNALDTSSWSMEDLCPTEELHMLRSRINGNNKYCFGMEILIYIGKYKSDKYRNLNSEKDRE